MATRLQWASPAAACDEAARSVPGRSWFEFGT